MLPCPAVQSWRLSCGQWIRPLQGSAAVPEPDINKQASSCLPHYHRATIWYDMTGYIYMHSTVRETTYFVPGGMSNLHAVNQSICVLRNWLLASLIQRTEPDNRKSNEKTKNENRVCWEEPVVQQEIQWAVTGRKWVFTVGRTFEKASFKLGIKDRGSYAYSSTGQTTQSRTLKFARSAAHGDSLWPHALLALPVPCH